MAHNELVILPQDRITNVYVARLVNRLRMELGDNKPAQRLFAPQREIWEDFELLNYLYDEMDDINVETPHTSWTILDAPESIHGLLITGAKVRALEQKIIKESEEYVQYNDNGLSLAYVKYQAYLSILQPVKQAHEQRRTKIKKTFRPTMIGIGKQQIPFNIARPLGMLPNLKNTLGV